MNHRAAALKTCCFKKAQVAAAILILKLLKVHIFKMPNPKKSRQDSIVTRSALTNWFLGTLLWEIPCQQLPTTVDCIRHYMYLKETEFDGKPNNSQKNHICKRVADAVIEIWHTASIYTIRKPETIQKKVRREVDKLEYFYLICQLVKNGPDFLPNLGHNFADKLVRCPSVKFLVILE